jgi:hypothetical protein
MVAPQKHNRQSLFFCLSSAVAHEALLLLAPKGNKKAQSSPLLLVQVPIEKGRKNWQCGG